VDSREKGIDEVPVATYPYSVFQGFSSVTSIKYRNCIYKPGAGLLPSNIFSNTLFCTAPVTR